VKRFTPWNGVPEIVPPARGAAITTTITEVTMSTTSRVPLRVERKDQDGSSGVIGGGAVLLTPDIGEDYWSYRVIVGEHQAVVGFPKFGLIGVGFAVEDECGWNTNLPHGAPAGELYDHIKRNKGDKLITRATCIEAIRLIDAAIREDKACTCRACQP
jgi:hypothetical protein